MHHLCDEAELGIQDQVAFSTWEVVVFPWLEPPLQDIPSKKHKRKRKNEGEEGEEYYTPEGKRRRFYVDPLHPGPRRPMGRAQGLYSGPRRRDSLVKAARKDDPLAYCTVCHKSGHYRSRACVASDGNVIGNILSNWGKHFDNARFTAASDRPEILVEAKDNSYSYSQFLNETMNAHMVERDELLTKIDDYLQTNLAGPDHQVWREYMSKCCLVEGELWKNLRDSLIIYLRESIQRPVEKLAAADGQSMEGVPWGNQRREDIEAYLSTISGNIEKVRITDYWVFESVLKQVNISRELYLEGRKVAEHMLYSIYRETPSLATTHAMTASLRVPGDLMVAFRTDPATTWSRDDFVLPSVKDITRIWSWKTISQGPKWTWSGLSMSLRISIDTIRLGSDRNTVKRRRLRTWSSCLVYE
jgi:hypothetical protein